MGRELTEALLQLGVVRHLVGVRGEGEGRGRGARGEGVRVRVSLAWLGTLSCRLSRLRPCVPPLSPPVWLGCGVAPIRLMRSSISYSHGARKLTGSR